MPPLFPEMKSHDPKPWSPSLAAEYERLHDLRPITIPTSESGTTGTHPRAVRALPAAQGGDGRVVCRLVLAHGRGVTAARPDAAELPRRALESGRHRSSDLAADLKFFHWELEFPDVFTPDRSGFDAMIGNPPWDVMKPNSQEFFTDFDPLYRTYDKQAASEGRGTRLQTVPGLAISGTSTTPGSRPSATGRGTPPILSTCPWPR